MSDKSISKYISLILRHKPEVINITLDEHGWADVQKLIDALKIDMPTLERIVSTDSKQRYSFNDDKTLIRANQGHSVNVDVELERVTPPEILYHGTGEKFAARIEREGLIPKSRLYVHLSGDVETARNVGQRHGRPVVFEVMSGKMHDDGWEFFLSVNGVWLVRKVPPEYLQHV